MQIQNRSIDINCDLGESFGRYVIDDDGIYPFISSASIACGYHAGDPAIIKNTIEKCLTHGVSIGAHPGFNDLVGFGRRELQLSEEQLFCDVLYQISALKSMTEAMGGKLKHVKPHGALYHMASTNTTYAKAITMAVKQLDPNLILVGLCNSRMEEAANNHQIPFVGELFADRRYTSNGMLANRQLDGAVITNNQDVINQALGMIITKKAFTVDNSLVDVEGSTLCIHGDGEHALEHARSIHKALQEKHIAIKAFSSLIK